MFFVYDLSSFLEWGEFLTILLVILISVVIDIIISAVLAKRKEMRLSPVTINAVIVEKRKKGPPTGYSLGDSMLSNEWYVVEDDHGIRRVLRALPSEYLILVVGDRGVLTYRGKTITNFRRTKSL